MKVIEEKKFQYILISNDTGWFLTFMSGGPVEIDFCVQLTDQEIKQIKDGGMQVTKLIQKLQANRDELMKRRIVPSIWPQ